MEYLARNDPRSRAETDPADLNADPHCHCRGPIATFRNGYARVWAWPRGRLGAGQAVKDDPVQAGAGIEIHAKPGDQVKAGQPLFTLQFFTDDEWRIPAP